MERRADKFVIKMLELLGNVCEPTVWLEKTVIRMDVALELFALQLCIYVIDMNGTAKRMWSMCHCGYDHCFKKILLYKVEYLQFHTKAWQAEDVGTFLFAGFYVLSEATFTYLLLYVFKCNNGVLYYNAN